MDFRTAFRTAIVAAVFCILSAHAASFDPTTTFVGVSTATLNGTSTQLTISSTDVPDNSTIKYGPLTQGITVPANQNLSLKYPYRGGMNESATTHTSDKYASGTVAITVAGLVIFGSGNGSTITINGTSWAYDANAAGINGEDIYGGHCAPNGGGTYHYHDIAFIRNNSWVGVSGFTGSSYRQSDGHSKLLGWSPDGYPIYGPYGYITPTDSTSGVQTMVSGWTATNTGTNRPPSVTATVVGAVNNSTTVIFGSDPGALGLNPGMRITTNSAGLASSTYYILNQANVTYVGGGHPPYTGATNSVTLNSAVTIPNGATLKFEYLPGLFIEDNSFTNTGTLDQYNGRFCVTPEYPNGTYAYFMTQDGNGKGVYPYMVGPSYYGSLTVGTASKLVFTQQPGNSSPGSTISPTVTVAIQTPSGAATTSTANVTLSLGANPGNGTLSGTTTVAAVNGVSTFSNLSINNLGTGYTLAASSSTTTGSILVTSNTFNVNSGATQLAFGVGPTTSVSGTSISPSVTVQLLNAQGSLTTSTANVTLAIGNNPNGGNLSGSVTVAAVNGTATFSNLSIDKAAMGYTLVATSSGLTSATSSAFDITVGAPAKLAFLQQPAVTVSNVSISPAVTVQIQDASGNPTTSTAGVSIAFGTNAGSGTLSGTTQANAVAGTATFSNLSIDKAGTGYTLNATSSGLTNATSSPFNITAGSPSKLVFGIQPANTLSTAAITPAVTVQLLDAVGNLTTSTANVAIAFGTNAGSGILSGSTSVAASAGTAVFSNLSIAKAAAGYTLSASSNGLPTVTSSPFNISAGPAAIISANSGTPQSTQVATAFTSTLQAKLTDAGGNPVPNTTVTFTAPPSGSSCLFSSSISVNVSTDSNGFAATPALMANTTAGSYTVTASAGALSTTYSLTNTPGTAANIVAKAGMTQSAILNNTFPTALQAKIADTYGNAVPGVTVTFIAPASGASGTFSNGTIMTTAPTDSTGVATASAFTANAAMGTYAVTASATGSGSASFPLTNFCIVITPNSISAGAVGVSYSATTFKASGGSGTVTLSETGTLPAGMNFNAGVLFGTPSQSGSFPITISAKDSTSCSASLNFTLTIGAPTITVSPTVIAPMKGGVAYNQLFSGNGGTAPYTFTTVSNTLPTGLTLGNTGVLSGTPTTEGKYAFIIVATDSSTGSGPFSGSASYSITVDFVPVFSSGLAYSPNPLLVLQPVTFSAPTLPADATLTWNFGDGSSNSATGSHIYTTAGFYTATVSAKNPRSGSSATTTLSVTVNPATAIVGIGPDSDGDGFSDAFETFVGTDPESALSTPTGQTLTADTVHPLVLASQKITLNFAKSGADTITFSGILPVPNTFNPNHSSIYFDVSGVSKAFTLNSKGDASNGGNSIKILLKETKGAVATQTAKFTATFKNGPFAAILANANMQNTNASGTSVNIVYTCIFNNIVYQKTQKLSYSAKQGKSGVAK